MKTNALPSRKKHRKNEVLALYITGITVFMAVYSTLTIVACM